MSKITGPGLDILSVPNKRSGKLGIKPQIVRMTISLSRNFAD